MSYYTVADTAILDVDCRDDTDTTVVTNSKGPNLTLVGAGGENTEDLYAPGPGAGHPNSYSLGTEDPEHRIQLASATESQNKSAITLEGWVYFYGTSTGLVAMFSSGAGDTASRFRCDVNATRLSLAGRASDADTFQRITATPAMVTGAWVHVVWQIDYANDVGKIYLNGSEQATTGSFSFDQDTTDNTASNYFTIGSNFNFTASGIADIARIRVWDSFLSDTDIAELYNGPEPINTAAPTSIYTYKQVDWTPGTWDNADNGTTTLLADVYKDGAVVASNQATNITTGGSYTTSDSNYVGDYSVVVKATNDGGNASDQDVTVDAVAQTYDNIAGSSYRDLTPTVSGTTYNGATFTSLDAHSSLVTTGNDLSVSFVVNVTSLSGRQILFESGAHVNGFSCYLDDDTLYMGWTNNSVSEFISTSFAGLSGRDIPITVSIKDQLMSLYLNDQAALTNTHAESYTAAGSDSGGIGGSTSNISFHDGDQVPSSGNYLTGSISEFYVFDSALPDEQIDILHAGRIEAQTYEEVLAKCISYVPLQDTQANTNISADIGPGGTLSANNSATVTETGPTDWLPNAIGFDNVRRVDFDSTLDVPFPYTIFAWAKTDSNDSSDAICGHSSWGNIKGFGGVSWKAEGVTTNVQTFGNPNYDDDTWRFVCFTFDGAAFTVYYDGVQVSQDLLVLPGENLSSMPINQIGAERNANYWSGALAGFGVAPKLTTNEMALLMNGPTKVETYEDLEKLSDSAWMTPSQNDTADDFHGKHDGTWNGTPAYSDGPYARAFRTSFNSSIDCGNVWSLDQHKSVTLLGRVKWDGTHTFGYIFGQSDAYGSGYSIKFQNSSAAGGFVGALDGTGPGIPEPATDTWFPIVIRMDAATQTATFRIGDGVETATGLATDGDLASPTFYIGERNTNGRTDMDISEVYLFKRALSDDEIDVFLNGPVIPETSYGELISNAEAAYLVPGSTGLEDYTDKNSDLHQGTLAQGKYGDALAEDSVSSYVDLATPPNEYPVTLALRCLYNDSDLHSAYGLYNPDDDPDQRGIEINPKNDGEGRLQFGSDPEAAWTYEEQAASNDWEAWSMTVVGQEGNGTIYGYRNGELVVTRENVPLPAAHNLKRLMLGGRPWGTNTSECAVSEVVVDYRAWSAEDHTTYSNGPDIKQLGYHKTYDEIVQDALGAWAMPDQVDTPDDFVNGNDATWDGTPSYADGPNGRAFDINGTHLDVPGLTLEDECSIMVRAYQTGSPSGNQSIFGNRTDANQNIFVFLDSSRRVNLELNGRSIRTPTNYVAPLDQWFTIQAVSDGTDIKCYLDGIDTDSPLFGSSSNITNPGANQIGLQPNGNDPMDGTTNRVAELVVWDRALTDNELSTMLAGPPANDYSYEKVMAKAIAVYNLQETEGTSFAEANGGISATCAVDASVMTTDGPNYWLPNAQSIQDGGTNWIRRENLGVAEFPYTMTGWGRLTTPAISSLVSAYRGALDYNVIKMDEGTASNGGVDAESRNATGQEFTNNYGDIIVDQWYHIAVTFYRDRHETYLDGRHIGTYNFTSPHSYVDGESRDLFIGGFRDTSNSEPIDVAQVGIWPALNDVEINALYRGPAATTHDDVITTTSGSWLTDAETYNGTTDITTITADNDSKMWSIWVKPASTPNNNMIIGGFKKGLRLVDSNSIQWTNGQGTVTQITYNGSGDLFPVDTWTHIGGRFNDYNGDLFINGSKVYSGDWSNGTPSSGFELNRLGGDSNGPTDLFAGELRYAYRFDEIEDSEFGLLFTGASFESGLEINNFVLKYEDVAQAGGVVVANTTADMGDVGDNQYFVTQDGVLRLIHSTPKSSYTLSYDGIQYVFKVGKLVDGEYLYDYNGDEVSSVMHLPWSFQSLVASEQPEPDEDRLKNRFRRNR